MGTPPIALSPTRQPLTAPATGAETRQHREFAQLRPPLPRRVRWRDAQRQAQAQRDQGPLCSAAGPQRPSMCAPPRMRPARCGPECLAPASRRGGPKRQELRPTGPGSHRDVAVQGMSGGVGPSAPQSPSQEEASDLEVAVFRFSLGLPFLDDKYVPRAAGIVLGTLLLLNHWLSTSGLSRGISPAQQVSEVVGFVLAVLLIVVPAVEARLQELKGGRRAASGGGGQSRRQGDASSGQPRKLFLLAPSLPPSAAQELAWASFTLLRNTNTASILLLSGSSVIFARGAWALPGSRPGDAPISSSARTPDTNPSSASSSAAQKPKDASKDLRALEQQLVPALCQSPELQRMLGAPSVSPSSAAPGPSGSASLEQVYLPSLSGAPAWAASLASLNPGTASLLMQPLRLQAQATTSDQGLSEQSAGTPGTGAGAPETGAGAPGVGEGGGVLVLLSDVPRAFSARDRAWVSAIGLKLSSLSLTA